MSAELSAPTLGVDAAAGLSPAMLTTAHMRTAPGTALGKRLRRAEDTHDDGDPGADDGQEPRPHKRGKTKMAAVLGAVRSTSRTRRKPATRTQTVINDKSKATGQGAGRLATTSAQRVYHQYLPGPSVQQVLTRATVPQELTWIEERVEGGTWHQYSSTVQQQVEEHSVEDDKQKQGEGDLFRISTTLKERHRTLLAATPADWKRGAVSVLKCRLCPGAGFRDWEGFKRHCDTTEAHPVAFSFCAHCGDFFARGDALWRHRNNPPNACIDVTPDEAEFKRRETNRVHEEFKVWEEHCLETGEDIGTPFSQIIKQMFPKSSKKGSREQCRLPAGKSRA